MKSNWAAEEDDLLIFAVKKYGKKNWNKISTLVENKVKNVCKVRWNLWLSFNIKKSIWEKKEDTLLINKIKFNTNIWHNISLNMGRNLLQSLYRMKLIFYFKNKKILGMKNQIDSSFLSKKLNFLNYQTKTRILNLKLRLLNRYGKKQNKKIRKKKNPQISFNSSDNFNLTFEENVDKNFFNLLNKKRFLISDLFKNKIF